MEKPNSGVEECKKDGIKREAVWNQDRYINFLMAHWC